MSTTRDDNDGIDLGWFGLAGMIGLVGLMARDRRDRNAPELSDTRSANMRTL